MQSNLAQENTYPTINTSKNCHLHLNRNDTMQQQEYQRGMLFLVSLLSESLEYFNNNTFCSDVDVDDNAILSWSTLVVKC